MSEVVNEETKVSAPAQKSEAEELDDKSQRGDVGVIGLLDMDAFEVQIYLKDRLGITRGRECYLTTPCVLVDATTDRVISVNFLAKAKDISREDRLGTALLKCPDLFVITKDLRFNKQESRRLRHSSWAVLDCIVKFRKENNTQMIIEYASNDEYYLDLTEEVNRMMDDDTLGYVAKGFDKENRNKTLKLGANTFLELKEQTISESYKILERANFYQRDENRFVCGDSLQELRLIMGCTIVEKIRNFIMESIGFDSSVGISVNKLLAKLACPLHKPAGITILPREGFSRISGFIPIEKLPSMGGERGLLLKKAMNLIENEGSSSNCGFTIRDFALLPFTKLSNPEIPIGRCLEVRKLSNGYWDCTVHEKLMKESASICRGNLRSLRFYKIRTIRVNLENLVAELKERLTEEESRHSRVPENILVTIFYILLPRAEEDRGKPPLNHEFLYPYDVDTFNDCTFINGIMDDFLKTVQDKEGVIVKIRLSIRHFIPIIKQQ